MYDLNQNIALKSGGKCTKEIDLCSATTVIIQLNETSDQGNEKCKSKQVIW